MLHSMVVSLLLTIVLETMTSFAFGIRKKSDFLVVLLANVYTNPIVVLLANLSLQTGHRLAAGISILILEVGAVWMEKWIFERYLSCPQRSFFLSLMNNSFSFFVGVILYLGARI